MKTSSRTSLPFCNRHTTMGIVHTHAAVTHALVRCFEFRSITFCGKAMIVMPQNPTHCRSRMVFKVKGYNLGSETGNRDRLFCGFRQSLHINATLLRNLILIQEGHNSSERVATGLTTPESNPRGGEVLRTCPVQPPVQRVPSLLPGIKTHSI
jgi:hypothetical protein